MDIFKTFPVLLIQCLIPKAHEFNYDAAIFFYFCMTFIQTQHGGLGQYKTQVNLDMFH